ncbi:hypothetical protein EJD97_022216 [Solanum chilense]|uniref:Uncharacterized protein n=1 Tax=Solanum chilense TaxID=4083 RepID=A0A6N2ATY1_SOLCI|nr:hypothetical protein EJD97_022216 [Solanum chilense]
MVIVIKTKIIQFFAFILVLILFSHEILCVEAIRHLKSKKTEVVSVEISVSTQIVVTSETFNKIGKIQKSLTWLPGKDDIHKSINDPTEATKSVKVVEKMDDFGPTGPGHSPGIGHSIHN